MTNTTPITTRNSKLGDMLDRLRPWCEHVPVHRQAQVQAETRASGGAAGAGRRRHRRPDGCRVTRSPFRAPGLTHTTQQHQGRT